MSQTQASGARRAVLRLRLARPLTLTVMLALAGCTSSQWAGSQASGADPAKLSPEQTEATLLKVADQTRAGGDFGTAVSLYKRAHEMAERDPVPLARLGETLAQMQAYNEAAEAYRQALALKDDPELHRGFGNLLLAMGKPQLALAQLQAAAEKNPNDARVYNGLGVAYDLTGRHDLAQETYRKGLALAPDQLSLRNNLGLSQALAADYTGAIATLSEVVTQPGASARNRQNLALVYGLSGDNQHAASVARADLDEQAVRSNLAYYTLLRSMDDLGRTAAILGADVRTAKLNEPAAIVKDSIIADAPKAAPVTPVQGQPLQNPQPAAAAAATDDSAVINLPVAKTTPPPSPAPEIAAPAKVSAVKPSATGKLATAAEPAPQIAALPRQPAPQIPAPQPAAPPLAQPAQPTVSAAEPPKPGDAAPKASVTLIGPMPAVTDPSPAVGNEAADSGKHLVVQIASFQSESIARKLSDELAAKGMGNLSVVHDRGKDGRDWYAVRTAEFTSAQAAESEAQNLRSNGAFGAVVLRVSSGRADDVAAAAPRD